MTFVHSPDPVILLWSIVIPPFTLWDTAYIFLRPHSLPGGKWHSPFFLPMETWATVDRSYGEAGYRDQDGFVVAQSIVNLVETLLCAHYALTVWGNGALHFRRGKKKIVGRPAARAVVVGLIAGVVTWTKTMLYFMRETASGYKYTSHNERNPIFTLWGVINIIYSYASLYMIAYFSLVIVDAMTAGERLRKE